MPPDLSLYTDEPDYAADRWSGATFELDRELTR